MSTREQLPGNEHDTAFEAEERSNTTRAVDTEAEQVTRQQVMPVSERVIIDLSGERTAPTTDPVTRQAHGNARKGDPQRQPDNYSRGDSLGRYMVLDLLGQGGMGAVYTAYDPELDRRVAVKLLRTPRENSRKRLVREARALAKLSHPNVVQVYDAGMHLGNVFVAMELVVGHSLKEWADSEPRPGWQEVLAAYLDAARGLAAAHESGLVHRDVKPANILRGNDGRVRVADFGLAAASQRTSDDTITDSEEEASKHAEPTPSGLQGSLDERLTVTGALMGTPPYMAPEQHMSAEVGPAADQYSLCVSLYEALYKQLPFTMRVGDSLAEILGKKLRAEIAPAPPNSPVPAWMFQVLRRGLSASPAERYPSMSALITALTEDREARRGARVRMVALGGVTLGLAALAVLGWAKTGVFDDPCEPERQERLLAGVWDEGVQARLETAFLATGKAYAGGTAERVSAMLGAYASDWVAMRTEVCRAHEEDDESRRELLGLRTLCLERRRSQLRALTEVLGASADAAVLDKAMTAVWGLYPISYCADEEALAARLPPPEDPALRDKVEPLQPRVDRLEALYQAGKIREGLAEAERLHTEVAGIPYVPLRAEAAYWLANMRIDTGDYQGALPRVQEALFLASQGADDALAAKTWGILLYTLVDGLKRLEEAKLLVDGIAAVADYTRDERARALLLGYLASTLRELGRYEEARAINERVLAIWEKAVGPEHPLVASSLNNLAALLAQTGKYEEAKTACERALAIWEKASGPEHPDVARALSNLATVHSELGNYEKARGMYQQALPIWEKALGPEHPHVATTLNNLADALARLGKSEEARVSLERALAIWEKALGPGHPEVARALSNLADMLADAGKHEEARAMSERALALRENALGPEHPDVATTLSKLADVLTKAGKYEEARAMYERALAVRDKAMGPEHPDGAMSRNNLASMLHETGKYAEAKALNERALAIWEKALGPEHPNVGLSLYNLANGLRETGKYEEAKVMYQRALALWEKALGPEHSYLMYPLVGMGRMLVAEEGRGGDLELGARHLERALAIGEKALTPEDPAWAETLLGQAELALAQKQLDDVVALLERALALDNPEYRADIQLALAEALWRAAGEPTRGKDARDKERARAVDLARQARDFCREIGHQPKLARAERWLAAHPWP